LSETPDFDDPMISAFAVPTRRAAPKIQFESRIERIGEGNGA
jgi:hypothetical protein